MKDWYIVTLVGADRPGIVARVTQALLAAGGNLGEASMLRMGANFTIMLMVDYPGDAAALDRCLAPVAQALDLHLHVDRSAAGPRQRLEPEVRVRVAGADRAGIVAQVTGALASAGLNILDLESTVAGSAAAPIYVLYIEGQAQQGLTPLAAAVAGLAGQGVDVSIEPIELVIG
jgi:glycine cleavage system transcriptional repressor